MADDPDHLSSLLQQWPLIAAVGTSVGAVAGLWRRMGQQETRQAAQIEAAQREIARHDADMADMRAAISRVDQIAQNGSLAVARLEERIAAMHETLKQIAADMRRDR